MTDLGSVAYAADGRWDDEPEPPKQYLAWGGEVEGYSIVTASQIAKDIESAGCPSWTDIALIAPRDVAAPNEPPFWPNIWPATIISSDKSYTDDNDYIYQSCVIVDNYGGVIEEFETRIDGRA